jgi:hypothetical protein
VDRWLTPEELAQVAPLPKSDKVQKLLGGTWTPAGVDGVRKDDTTAGAGVGVAATAPQVATEQAAQPQAQPQVATVTTAAADDDDDSEIIMGLDAPAATPAQGAAQGTPVPPAKTTEAPKAAAAEVQPEVAVAKDPQLAALLADWGGE